MDNFDSGMHMMSKPSDVLMETDSEPGEVLVQSESDQEQLVATPPHEVLLETDSEGDHPEPPCKKQRKYAKNRTADHGMTFLQQPVCRHAHMRLYSISSGALQNMRKGNRAFTMKSGRLQEPKHPTLQVSLVRSTASRKWPSIMSFFWLLWMSSAEILPIKFTMPGHKDGSYVESSMSKDPDFQERYVQNFLGCLEKNYDMNPAIWQIYFKIQCS